jgi:sulfur relay (sulfurtransferase) DsrF/TusC family protein
MDFVKRLNECSDFSCIFELVKIAVEVTINRRRAGLILGLTDLPNYIGAFHQMGSNFIIMNRKLLKEVIRSGNKKLINAYTFHVLLHEYIHSLGFMDEQQTQLLTHAISEKVLGSNHPATLISKYGIGAVFSNISRLEHYEPQETREIEIIEDFEMDNLNYFG